MNAITSNTSLDQNSELKLVFGEKLGSKRENNLSERLEEIFSNAFSKLFK